MRPSFMAPGFNGGHFDHVAISMREFSDFLKSSEGFEKAKPRPIGPVAGLSPRFDAARAHLLTNPAIPQPVRDEAAKHSRELVFALTTFRSKIIRGQSHGSLDSSKLSRLASPGLAPREFDRLAATAYRRREHVQSVTTRPRIAIVADMNNEIRSANPTYTKMLGRLAFIIGEAAKIAGVEVLTCGSRGWHRYGDDINVGRALATLAGCPSGNRDTRPHVVTVLKGWNDDVTGSEYALFTDATKFALSTTVWGTLNICAPEFVRSVNGMTSQCGAGGIEFARSQGANLVIAFGNFDATEKADMTFRPDQSVDDVVRGIVAALSNSEAA